VILKGEGLPSPGGIRMSEKRVVYQAQKGSPVSLEAFKGRGCTRRYTDGYEPPTPIEVDALIQLMGWTQRNISEITGVTYSVEKGSTTVRKWKTKDPNSKDYRQIPFSPWRLLLFQAGVISCDELRLM